MVSRDLLLRDVEAADLTQQLLVGQTPPEPQRLSGQRRDALWHEHASVWSVSREQHVSEAAALNAGTCAAVTHPAGSGDAFNDCTSFIFYILLLSLNTKITLLLTCLLFVQIIRLFNSF